MTDREAPATLTELDRQADLIHARVITREGLDTMLRLAYERGKANAEARPAAPLTAEGWECGAMEAGGFVCGRPMGHKGMHRRRSPLPDPLPAAPQPDEALRAALEVWLFPKGLNHPEHWSLTNEGAEAIALAAKEEG